MSFAYISKVLPSLTINTSYFLRLACIQFVCFVFYSKIEYSQILQQMHITNKDSLEVFCRSGGYRQCGFDLGK